VVVTNNSEAESADVTAFVDAKVPQARACVPARARVQRIAGGKVETTMPDDA
jgi:hypothetical protein